MVVAPEGFLEGYVVHDVIVDPSLAEAMRKIAEPLNGPYLAQTRQLAAGEGVALCVGFAERRRDGLYNAAVFVGSDGEIHGVHRKTIFGTGTHPDWWFNRAGRAVRAFDTPIGRVRIFICNERWQSRIAGALAADGAELLLIPSYGSRRRRQNEAVVARGRETGLPIVQAGVGVNLIMDRGEMIAYHWGADAITTADIHPRMAPSPRLARKFEREYLAFQADELARRFRRKFPARAPDSGPAA